MGAKRQAGIAKGRLGLPEDYDRILGEIRGRIREAQVRASFAASSELIRLYWDIGRTIVERQRQAGWGSGVLRRLAADLRNELPDVKGFSERNLKLMTQFYREYSDLPAIGQQPVAQLPVAEGLSQDPLQPAPRFACCPAEKVQQLVAQLPWGHNILLIRKVKELATRLWYMRQCLEQGWSRNVLDLMIKSEAHSRQGRAITNFDVQLPAPQSDLAQQALKDPYVFDFLTIEEPFRERELETGLVRHLQRFLLELGTGFAFVGRQYHLVVGEEDFYIDLLFYHLELRCFVVIDLKKGPFKPDYAGKMNFYLNVVDDRLGHETDSPTIGLILCQDRKRVLAEYALRGLDKPIGVSEYELTRALPDELRSALPTIEEIEAELQSEIDVESGCQPPEKG